jgi:hypothetical protein
MGDGYKSSIVIQGSMCSGYSCTGVVQGYMGTVIVHGYWGTSVVHVCILQV